MSIVFHPDWSVIDAEYLSCWTVPLKGHPKPGPDGDVVTMLPFSFVCGLDVVIVL
jgi:hypothetical protein